MRLGWTTSTGEGDEPGTRPLILTSAAPSVSLTQHGVASGMFRVNLTWERHPLIPLPRGERTRTFLPSRLEPPPLLHGREVDLDLACFYEFTTGQRGVVQVLGHRRGSYERPPYIRLDQDDRSGSATGENIFVNLDHADDFSRILIFVFAYTGAFQGANAKVTFIPTAGPTLEINLDAPTKDARTCAVALLQRQGKELILQREMFYTTGFQSELDRQYGWGMRWAEGQKNS